MAAVLALMLPVFCCAQSLTPVEALDQYLRKSPDCQPGCTDAAFMIQIDASIPALKKYGSMSGFKRIIQPGHSVYRGLRFTGDNLVKTEVIAPFLARETLPPQETRNIAVTPLNYIFGFHRSADYNGLTAYVFLLKPRRKRAGLFRGELWLDAESAAPLRLWGDLVKSPSFFVRSLRFAQDYQTVGGCGEPLRLLLTTRTRIAGTVEMTVWLHPASEEPETMGVTSALTDFKHGGATDKED